MCLRIERGFNKERKWKNWKNQLLQVKKLSDGEFVRLIIKNPKAESRTLIYSIITTYRIFERNQVKRLIRKAVPGY